MDCDDRDYLKGWGFDSNVCNLCGKKNSEVNGLLMQCGRCKKVYYCSRQCFNDGLPDHNLVCNTIDKITRDPTLSKDSTPPIPSLESKSKEINEYNQQKPKQKKVSRMDEPSSVPSKVNEDSIYVESSKESRKSSKDSKKVKKKEIPDTSSHQNTDDEDHENNEPYNSPSKRIKKQKQPSTKKSFDIPLSENMESHNDEHVKSDKSVVTDKGKKKSKKERRSSVTNNPINDATDEISDKKDIDKQIQPTSENTFDAPLSEVTATPDNKLVKSDKSMVTEKDKKKSKKERRSSVTTNPIDDTTAEISDKKENHKLMQPTVENTFDAPVSEITATPDDKHLKIDKSMVTDKDKKKSRKERRSSVGNDPVDDIADEMPDSKNNKNQIQPTSENTFDAPLSESTGIPNDIHVQSDISLVTDKDKKESKKERRSSISNAAVDDTADEIPDPENIKNQMQPMSEKSFDAPSYENIVIPDGKHIQSDKSMVTNKDKKKSKKERRSSVSNAPVNETADDISDLINNEKQIQLLSENVCGTPLSDKGAVSGDDKIKSDQFIGTDKCIMTPKKERRSSINNAPVDDTADEIPDPKNNHNQIQPKSGNSFGIPLSDKVDVSGKDKIESDQSIATDEYIKQPKKERRSSVTNDAIVDIDDEISDILEQTPELLKTAVLAADDCVVTPTTTDINDAICPGDKFRPIGKKTMPLDNTEECAMQQLKARSPQQSQSIDVVKTDTITDALNDNDQSRDTVDISDSDDWEEETIVEVSVTVDRIKSEPDPITSAGSLETPNANDKKQWTAASNLQDDDNKKGGSYGRGKRLDKAKDADKERLQLRQVSNIVNPAKGEPNLIISGDQQGGYVTCRESPSNSIQEVKDCDQDSTKHTTHDGEPSILEERSSAHNPLLSEVAPPAQGREFRKPTMKLRPNRSEETGRPMTLNRNHVETCLSAFFSDIPTAKISSYLGDLKTFDNNSQSDTQEPTGAENHQQQNEGIVGKNGISLCEAVNKCNVTGNGGFNRNKISDGSNKKLQPTDISKKTYGWEIPEWASKQRKSHANRMYDKHDDDVTNPESLSLPLISKQARDEVDAETKASTISIVAESELAPPPKVSEVAKKVEYPLHGCLDTTQNQKKQSPSPQLHSQDSNINTEEKLASCKESDIVDTSGSDEWEEETIVEVSVTVERMQSCPKPIHSAGTLVLTNDESSTTQVSNKKLQGDSDKQLGLSGRGKRLEKRKEAKEETQQLRARTDPSKEKPNQENEEILLNIIDKTDKLYVKEQELQLDGLGPEVAADEFQYVTKKIQRDSTVKYPTDIGKVVMKQKIGPKLVGKLGIPDTGDTKRLAIKIHPKHADLFRIRGMGRPVKLRRDDVENHLATILSRIPAEQITSYLSDDDIKAMTDYENYAPTQSKDASNDNGDTVKRLELKKDPALLPSKNFVSKTNQLRRTDIERKSYGWEVPEWANKQRNSNHGCQPAEISNRNPFAHVEGTEGSSEPIVSTQFNRRIEDAELATEMIVIPEETVDKRGNIENETVENGAITSITTIVYGQNNNVESEENSDDDVSVDDGYVKTGAKKSTRNCGKLAASRLSVFGKETKECEREKPDWTTNRSLRGCSQIKKEYGWEKPDWVDKAASLHSRKSFTMTSSNPASALSMNEDDTSSNDEESLCGEDFDIAANLQNQHFIAEVNEYTTQSNEKQESESHVKNKATNHNYVFPIRREDLLDQSSEHSRASSSICSSKSMNSLHSYGSCQSLKRVSQHNYKYQAEKDSIQSKPPSWTNNIFLRTTEKGRVLKDKGDIVLPSKPAAILDSGKVKWEKPDWVSKSGTLRKVSSKETMH